MKFEIIYLDRVDSTNRYARQLLNESSASEGTVIWAGEQYAGRGLGNNSWHSQAGMNLTFSIILEPLFLPPDRQISLNKAVALAVLSSVKLSLPTSVIASIKWPNDIYASNNKLAGILIEHNLISRNIKNSVIGVGINLNQETFPAGLPNPVSLKQITGIEYDIKKMLGNTCECLLKEYNRLKNGKFPAIDIDYNSSLFGFGKDLEFISANSSFTGRILGVDDTGRLSVMTADGLVRSFNHGEIIQKAK